MTKLTTEQREALTERLADVVSCYTGDGELNLTMAEHLLDICEQAIGEQYEKLMMTSLPEPVDVLRAKVKAECKEAVESVEHGYYINGVWSDRVGITVKTEALKAIDEV